MNLATYACGWGTLTMAPLMLPMKTMLPLAFRAICHLKSISNCSKSMPDNFSIKMLP